MHCLTHNRKIRCKNTLIRQHSQFHRGFVNAVSASNAAVNLEEIINKEMANKQPLFPTFLDAHEVFNKVWCC